MKICGLNLIFYIFLLFFLQGCAAEYNIATGKEELVFISPEREVKMGRSIARRVEERFGLLEDVNVQNRVYEIGKRIAAVCDRKDIVYHFAVIEGHNINAFSLPGGYVFVNEGLVDKVENDDELASVLAHEVAHIVARHSVKRLQASMGYEALYVLMAVSGADIRLRNGIDVALTTLMLGYSREDEYLSDRLGIKYMKAAGYNPDGAVNMLKKLWEVEKERPIGPMRYGRTHPYIHERIAASRSEIAGRMEFVDYINMEREE